MFLTLLVITFAIAFVVSAAVVWFFQDSIERILARIVADELAGAWLRYIKFAAYVVGISGGVRIYQLERYVHAHNDSVPVLTLGRDAWVLEVYRTVIETLQSLAWMLLVVFIFCLIAFVIVRAFELRRPRGKEGAEETVDRD
jgi:hypothetical protein